MRCLDSIECVGIYREYLESSGFYLDFTWRRNRLGFTWKYFSSVIYLEGVFVCDLPGRIFRL